MSPVEHPARLVRMARIDIGFQQGELHKIQLCAAAADAFELLGNRFKRVDRGGEISYLIDANARASDKGVEAAEEGPRRGFSAHRQSTAPAAQMS